MLEKLHCDNINSFKGFYYLVMVRGKRRVFIGLFPSASRANNIAAHLDWGGFHPEIEIYAPGLGQKGGQ